MKQLIFKFFLKLNYGQLFQDINTKELYVVAHPEVFEYYHSMSTIYNKYYSRVVEKIRPNFIGYPVKTNIHKAFQNELAFRKHFVNFNKENL